MSQTNRIPVLVLNWHGYDDTEKCIDHLLNQRDVDLTIHLMDNGSGTEEEEKLRELAKKSDYIQLTLYGENLGFTEAHNRKIRELLSDQSVRGILLLNNDAFAEPDWAKNLLKTAEETKAGMVSSKMINYFHPDQLDNIGHRILNTGEVLPKGSGESIHKSKRIQSNCGACAGAAYYDAEMLRSIGVFDPYFITGYEDAELGIRALVTGYESIYAPDAVVFHKISQSIAKVRDFSYVLKVQKNIFYSYFKLMPLGVILINIPFILFKYFLVLLINLLLGRWFFFRVMSTAICHTFTREWRTVLSARHQFASRNKRVSSFQILRRLEFFLWFDIKRFYRHIIKGEKTQFEKVD